MSPHPSIVSLPAVDRPYPSILNFLARRFPNVSAEEWASRIVSGKVLSEDRTPVTLATPYVPHSRLLYFREVPGETKIPFAERIVFQNPDLLVACKPHYLPVTPAGRFVRECLLNRLRERTGIEELAPIHRIDRATAGLVLFSTNQRTRARYYQLFREREVRKTYSALSALTQQPAEAVWTVEDRMVAGQPWFRMRTVPGMPNTRSKISLTAIIETRGRFRLEPMTGKKHQLRVHMAGLGFSILNDRFYPELLPEQDDDFANPLQLIARSLEFRDPANGRLVRFESERQLECS